MQELLVLTGNPKRRKSGKRRSPAQRAATRRMLAANRSRFHSNPKRRKSRRKSSAVASAAPVRHRRRSTSRRVARRAGRRSGGSSFRSMGSGLMGMAKAGAIAGSGAILNDVAMGLLQQAMPTTQAIAGPVNTDGSINYTYYAAKAATAFVIGRYFPMRNIGPQLGAGAFAVLAYQILRGVIPAGAIPMGRMGFYNPARIASGGIGKIIDLPNRMSMPGANAASVMRMAGRNNSIVRR